MHSKHHRSPEAAALILASRTIARARKSARSATDGPRAGQHRADFERAFIESVFIEMRRRGFAGRPIPTALGARLPVLLLVDRGETLSSYQARMRALLGLTTVRKAPVSDLELRQRRQPLPPKACRDDHEN